MVIGKHGCGNPERGCEMSNVTSSRGRWPLLVAGLVAVGNGLVVVLLRSPLVSAVQFGVGLGATLVVLAYALRFRRDSDTEMILPAGKR